MWAGGPFTFFANGWGLRCSSASPSSPHPPPTFGNLIFMSNGLAVSVLDLVGMRTGESAGSAIARSVELAQHVERLGYKRFWLAEHHSIEGLACSATPVLIGHVAGATSTIRVGSGGVMLPNHAPLVVAEQFGTLDAIYPGRIDLGLGRAPGGDFHTMRALRRDHRQTGDDFPAIAGGVACLSGDARAGQAVKAIPGQGSHVPITLLGSSAFSAQLAAAEGLPFAFAAHFAPEYLYAAARLYLEQFPSERRLEAALLDGGRAGDRGRNRCGRAPLVHDAPAKILAADPESARGAAASGGFDGWHLGRLGARRGGEQAGRGDCRVEGDGKSGPGRVGDDDDSSAPVSRTTSPDPPSPWHRPDNRRPNLLSTAARSNSSP